MTSEELKITQLMLSITAAILEAVDKGGDLGAPSGALYAALSASGASLTQYTTLMQTLVDSKYAYLDATQCYHLTPDGRVFLNKLQEMFNPGPTH